MTTIYLTRTGQTAWDAQDRIDSAAGSPLSRQGQEYITGLADDLAEEKIVAVYASTGEAELQAGRQLAGQLDAKLRKRESLREMDYGLLQGLTREEFRKRHTKLCKLWDQAPEGFRAPNGETLEEVRLRIEAALREIVKKHKTESVALVLRPVALAVAQCILQDEPLDQIQAYLGQAAFTWTSFETRPDRFSNKKPRSRSDG